MRIFEAALAALIAILLICACSTVANALPDGAPPGMKMTVDGGAVAASVPTANEVPTPTTVKDALETGKNAVAAAKSGNWWLFSSLVILVLLFMVKYAGTKIWGYWAKLGRWRYVIPPVLSLAAALLAAFQGGVSIDVAVGVFTAGWATSSWQELWEHGILGKARKGTPT